jgi:hypothetical protein
MPTTASLNSFNRKTLLGMALVSTILIIFLGNPPANLQTVPINSASALVAVSSLVDFRSSSVTISIHLDLDNMIGLI